MKKIKGITLAIISSSTFGLIPIFAIPALKGGLGLDSVLFYRFFFSALLMGIYLVIRGENLSINRKELLTLFFLGGAYALTAMFLTASYMYIPSGIATTIHFLYPILVTSIMILFFKEKASLPLMIATILAISGVYFLSSGEGTGVISFKGLVMVLFTVLTYALYIVGVNKSVVRNMDGLKMTFYVLSAAGFIFLINILAKGQIPQSIPDSYVAINLILLALIPTLISDLTLILAIQNVGSTTTAVLGCMEPLTAILMGVLFLNESFGVIQIIGVVFILLAVILVIFSDKLQFVITSNLNMLFHKR